MTAPNWTPRDVAECASCGTPIVFAVSVKTGGRIAVDWKPTADGTVSLRQGAGGDPAALHVQAHHRFGRTDLHMPHAANCRVRRPGIGTPHAFEVDEQIPADFNGRRWCAGCSLPGAPGDARHPHGALPRVPVAAGAGFPPAPAAAVALDARILGERDA